MEFEGLPKIVGTFEFEKEDVIFAEPNMELYGSIITEGNIFFEDSLKVSGILVARNIYGMNFTLPDKSKGIVSGSSLACEGYVKVSNDLVVYGNLYVARDITVARDLMAASFPHNTLRSQADIVICGDLYSGVDPICEALRVENFRKGKWAGIVNPLLKRP